jgi:hypothetical protein
LRLKDIVEVQRDAMVLVVGSEGTGLRRAWIEQRQHVGDAALAMRFKFFKTADGEQGKAAGFMPLV